MIIVLTPLVEDENYFLWADLDAHEKVGVYEIREPIWFRKKHPFITVFFYGTAKVTREDVIRTNDINYAIYHLRRHYQVDYIVHLPKDLLLNFDHLYEAIQQWKGEGSGTDAPKSLEFVYHQDQFYPFSIGILPVGRDPEANREYVEKHFKNSEDRPIAQYIQSRPFEVISLGGWCGIASALNDILQIRQGAYPFDYIHCTISCVIEVVKGNQEAFFQQGTYTMMPHHDMDKKKDMEAMLRRLDRFIALLEQDQPLLFARTIVSLDYRESFKKIQEFMQLLEQKYNRRQDRMLLLLHDQYVGTVKVKMLQKNIMVWAVTGEVGWLVPNWQDIYRNYAKAIEYCLDERVWQEDEVQLKNHTIVQHRSWGIRKNLFY